MRMAERSGQHIDEDDEKLLEKETKKSTFIQSFLPPHLLFLLSNFLTSRLFNLLLSLRYECVISEEEVTQEQQGRVRAPALTRTRYPPSEMTIDS